MTDDQKSRVKRLRTMGWTFAGIARHLGIDEADVRFVLTGHRSQQ